MKKFLLGVLFGFGTMLTVREALALGGATAPVCTPCPPPCPETSAATQQAVDTAKAAIQAAKTMTAAMPKAD